MSRDEMMECLIFDWFIQTFHINGFTTYITRFLNKHAGISYADFYDKFYNFLQKDDWFLTEQEEVKGYYNNWMTVGRIQHPKIGNVEVHGWNLVHRTTLNIHKHNKYSHVFDLISKFVLGLDVLDNDLADELLEFQRSYVVDYNEIYKFPVTKQFNYNFLEYIQENRELKTPMEYKFEFLENKDISLNNFLENIYFGRKRNFGKSLITFRHNP